MQDTFARARTRPSARATIGYLAYKCTYRFHNYSFSASWDFWIRDVGIIFSRCGGSKELIKCSESFVQLRFKSQRNIRCQPFVCKIPLLARRTRPKGWTKVCQTSTERKVRAAARPSARAMIGYLVYKSTMQLKIFKADYSCRTVRRIVNNH